MRYEVRRRDRDDGQIDYVVEDEGGSQVCDVPEDYYEGDVGAQRRAAERIAWALHVQETGPGICEDPEVPVTDQWSWFTSLAGVQVLVSWVHRSEWERAARDPDGPDGPWHYAGVELEQLSPGRYWLHVRVLGLEVSVCK